MTPFPQIWKAGKIKLFLFEDAQICKETTFLKSKRILSDKSICWLYLENREQREIIYTGVFYNLGTIFLTNIMIK